MAARVSFCACRYTAKSPSPDFGGGGQPVAWEGLEDGGNVARNQEVRFETPTLESGRYVFELTGTNDADLYVRVGSQPTFELFDCRPFKSGSRETCAVNITTPAAVHIMVRGWATSSDWQLVGAKD